MLCKVKQLIIIIFDKIKADFGVYHRALGLPYIVLCQVSTLDITLWVKFEMTATFARFSNQLTSFSTRFMIFGVHHRNYIPDI